MGLDQWAYKTCRELPGDVDFPKNAPDEWYETNQEQVLQESWSGDETFTASGAYRADTELCYWRKHPNLHGWMQQVYEGKGGSTFQWGSFSGPVKLNTEDIDALEEAVNAGSLPHTTGFFFGESVPEQKEMDLKFIQLAREALADGWSVYYDSWW